jgi:hypothetical protein
VPAPSSQVSPVYPVDSGAAPSRQIKDSGTVAIKFTVSAIEAAELFTSRRALVLRQSQHSAKLNGAGRVSKETAPARGELRSSTHGRQGMSSVGVRHPRAFVLGEWAVADICPYATPEEQQSES